MKHPNIKSIDLKKKRKSLEISLKGHWEGLYIGMKDQYKINIIIKFLIYNCYMLISGFLFFFLFFFSIFSTKNNVGKKIGVFFFFFFFKFFNLNNFY
jgi:hypothetical protein